MQKIAGFYNLKNNYDYKNNEHRWLNVLKNMNQELNFGNERNDNCKLFYNFGITSPSCQLDINGKQYLVVFNGELYNKQSLIDSLENKNDLHSDSLLILHLYLRWDKEFVKKLNGIFSFIIWDESKNSLYLYRDFIGSKPLYYTIFNDTLIFSSKLSAIFKYPDFKPSLDTDSFCEIFGLGPGRTPGKAVFKDIKEVLPAHYMIVNPHCIEDKRYWQLESKYHKETYLETVDHTSFLFRNSIKNQTKTNLPFCTLLSGGLDSSLVSAISSKILAEEGQRLHSYSFDFVDNSIHFKSNSFQPSTDKPYVDIMVNHLNSKHVYLECDNDDLISGLYESVDSCDLPNMADVWSSLLYFCKEISKNHKIALTGECADEIFGGYPWFTDSNLLNHNGFPWSTNIETRKLFLSKDFLSELELEQYIANAYESTIKETPLLESETMIETRRREMFYINLRWFMATLVERMDRTSNYSNIIARSPFADIELIEYLWNIPWKMKYSNNTTKGLLRDVAKSYLPKDILYRKKSPYPKTYNPEYEKILGNLLLEELNSSNCPLNNIVDSNKIKDFVTSPSDYGKPWYGQLMAGPQLLAYYLQINYWMKKYL